MQFRQEGQGDLVANVAHTNFSYNGYSNAGQAQEGGDAIEVEEMGEGDCECHIEYCNVSQCKAQGYDVSDNDNGDLFFYLNSSSCYFAQQDAVSPKETGNGNLDFLCYNNFFIYSGDDGINVKEKATASNPADSQGNAVVNILNTSVDYSTNDAIQVYEDDEAGPGASGSLYFSMSNSYTRVV